MEQPRVGMVVLGHGIDLVVTQRIAGLLESHPARFRDRVFTRREQDYCELGPKRRNERYAVRFAAKEAALKALGTGWRSGIAWTDVEVVSQVSGQPRLEVHGRCLEIAAKNGVDTWLVSLSHVAEHAVASVLAGTSHPRTDG